MNLDMGTVKGENSMKKLTILMLAGCMAVALSFGLAACNKKPCEHTYDNACNTACLRSSE